MHNVNSWLLALAFLLGLVITLAFLLRRVKREVPEYGSGSGAARLTGSAAGVKGPKGDLPDVDAPTAKVPKISVGGAVAAGAAGAVGGASAAKLVGSGGDSGKDSEPYGAGSLRLTAGAVAPSGWTIKGNEDSMLYHTTESPSYKRTIAEVWFFDEDTARKAGFTHWKEGRKGGTDAAKFATTEPEVPPGPHGPGSATPWPSGSGPARWTVKGNEDSMLYHSPESPAYAVTGAEVWFRDVTTAEAAGFNRWDSGKSQRGK
jgi:hypothetical protein